ncbi:MAG TPA: ABC transporter permease subunit [Ignavibacteriaceae bacterium]|jgi:ABC-2 type transport system permease protein|nr:ABC transporter permease subunit [Ignavibacteriaceae bacterium]
MKNIWTVTWYSLREALARKVFIFFFVISILTIIFVALILNLTGIEKVFAPGVQPDLFNAVNTLEMMFISPITLICLLLSIFSSASFIPIMLEKGNIDLLLSKPISREQLLLGKFFGGILVVFLNIAFLIIGVWLIFSFKFSIWNFEFLITIFTITFIFSILYSIIVFFGIITKSSTLGMMIAYLLFLIVSPALYTAKYKFALFIQNNIIKGVIDFAYYILPKTSELMGKTNYDLASGHGITNYQPVLTSLLFLVLTLGISVAIFRKKDF